jgi:hypothetical protein
MNNPKPTPLQNLKTGVQLFFIVAGIYMFLECCFKAAGV